MNKHASESLKWCKPFYLKCQIACFWLFCLIFFKTIDMLQRFSHFHTSILSTAGGAEDHRWVWYPAVAMVSGILGTTYCMVIGGKTIREGKRLCCFFLCAFEDHIEFLYLVWHLESTSTGKNMIRRMLQ